MNPMGEIYTRRDHARLRECSVRPHEFLREILVAAGSRNPRAIVNLHHHRGYTTLAGIAESTLKELEWVLDHKTYPMAVISAFQVNPDRSPDDVLNANIKRQQSLRRRLSKSGWKFISGAGAWNTNKGKLKKRKLTVQDVGVELTEVVYSHPDDVKKLSEHQIQSDRDEFRDEIIDLCNSYGQKTVLIRVMRQWKIHYLAAGPDGGRSVNLNTTLRGIRALEALVADARTHLADRFITKWSNVLLKWMYRLKVTKRDPDNSDIYVSITRAVEDPTQLDGLDRQTEVDMWNDLPDVIVLKYALARAARKVFGKRFGSTTLGRLTAKGGRPFFKILEEEVLSRYRMLLFMSESSYPPSWRYAMKEMTMGNHPLAGMLDRDIR